MKLLVVVDYQNDFVDGVLGFEKAKALEDKLATKIEKHIQEGGKVLFTMDTHMEDYLETREGKALPTPHCIQGTSGWDLHGKVKNVFDKHVLNSSEETPCYMMFKDSFGMDIGLHFGAMIIKRVIKKCDEIEICGVVTNMCVISVAVSLQSIAVNIPITVDASLCASFDDELHEKALDIMQGLQMNVINRGERND